MNMHIPARQEGLRALPIVSSIPEGCLTFPVTDDHFYPHLRSGEFAVIDLSDRQPQRGELFVIAYDTPHNFTGKCFQICGTVGRIMPRWPTEAQQEMAWYARHSLTEARLSEGPMTTDLLRTKLLGRVQGVFIPFGGEAHG